MRHASSSTWQKNYIPRHIAHDTAALFRGLETQDAVIRAAIGMRRTIDKRRPCHLSDLEKRKLYEDPIYKDLEGDFKRGRSKIQECKKQIKRYRNANACKDIRTRDRWEKQLATAKAEHAKVIQTRNSHRTKLSRRVMKEVLDIYDVEQPTRNIQQQLDGLYVNQQTKEDIKFSEYIVPQRQRVVEALLHFASEAPAEGPSEIHGRVRAIEAIAALSTFKQPSRPQNRPRALRTANVTTIDSEQLPFDPKSHCIFCYGDPHIPRATLTRFGRTTDLRKHVKNLHMKKLPTDCPFPDCKERCRDSRTLLNYMERVHNAVVGKP